MTSYIKHGPSNLATRYLVEATANTTTIVERIMNTDCWIQKKSPSKISAVQRYRIKRRDGETYEMDLCREHKMEIYDRPVTSCIDLLVQKAEVCQLCFEEHQCE